MPCPSTLVSSHSQHKLPTCAERKGKILHLLKAGSKPVQFGRKRKRYEVFDPQKDAENAHRPPPQPPVKNVEMQQPSENTVDTTAKIDKSTLRQRQRDPGEESKK